MRDYSTRTTRRTHKIHSSLACAIVLVITSAGVAPRLRASSSDNIDRTSNFHLKIDLAVPKWKATTPQEPRPATAKEGWIAWSAPRWRHLYMEDGVWLPSKHPAKCKYPLDYKGKPYQSGSADFEAGIRGTGIRAYLVAGGHGKGHVGALHANGLCRSGLGGYTLDEPPSGEVEGDPIANTYYYACDWAGPIWGDVVLMLENLPAGEYHLKSYHNFWQPVKSSERNCRKADSIMPPMPSITVHPLTSELVQDHNVEHIERDKITAEEVAKDPTLVEVDTDDPYLKRKVIDIEGNPYLHEVGLPSPDPDYQGEGVKALKNAYDVPVTSTLIDEEVSTSSVRFKTDGHRVVVIYEAPGWEYKDRARPDRPGGTGILNAFELKRVARTE